MRLLGFLLVFGLVITSVLGSPLQVRVSSSHPVKELLDRPTHTPKTCHFGCGRKREMLSNGILLVNSSSKTSSVVSNNQ